jgi:hypothetical protein
MLSEIERDASFGHCREGRTTPDHQARHARRSGCQANGGKIGSKPKRTLYEKLEALRRRDIESENVRSIVRSYNVSAATISRLGV